MARIRWLVLVSLVAGPLMATVAPGCRADRTMERVSLLEDPPFPEIVGDTPVEPLPVPSSENVGSVAGRASVEGGAASYSIPIDIPPGRRGVQPQVSLEYSSRNGNGPAGVGWALDAGSNIHRCPQTVAQDGQTHGVNFSSGDRLCLDGRRLVVTRGEYGRMGSRYRTEVDSFTRVSLFNNMDEYGSFFRVETRDGMVHDYGDRDNAVYMPPGADAPAAWKLRRSVDPQGNSIEYTYGPSATGHVLTEIRYTGSGTTPGNRRVVFAYEPGRPDVGHAYRSFALMVAPLRLTNIRTYVDNALVRRYALEYRVSPATGRSLLRRIRVCGNESCTGTDTTPWTEFSYSDDALAVENVPLAESGAQERQVRLVGDYDGDGTRDRLVLEYPDPRGGIPSRRLLYLSSRGPPLDLSVGPWFGGFDSAAAGNPSARDTDFDRDGAADLVGRGNAGRFVVGSWRGGRMVQTDSNLTLADSAYLIDVADMDADGDVDVLLGQGGVVTLHENCTVRGSATLRFCGSAAVTTLEREDVVRVADFDGNGLPDLYIDWSGYGSTTATRLVFTYRGSGGLAFSPAGVAERGGPVGSFKAIKGTGFFDANGDGLLDIFRLPDGLWLNKGGRFEAVERSPGTIDLHHNLFGAAFALDMDADGRDELLIPAELVNAWCWIDAAQAELTEYCGEDFLLGEGPEDKDRSIYRWDAVHVRFDGSGRAWFQRVSTPLTAPVRATRAEDFFGDGLADLHYRIINMYGDLGAGSVPLGAYALPLPRGDYVARNLGAGRVSDADGKSSGKVPDVLQSVRDGLGRTVAWEHAPLSRRSVAGCPDAVQKPLYRANREAAAPHHVHFTSSMQVVARFVEPDGIGGENATCYRYEDAMYSDEGRGFQGFRAIIAEQVFADDPQNNLRTTTRYHDAFPLTGRVARVEIHRADDGPERPPLRDSETTWDADCSTRPCIVTLAGHVQRVRDLDTREILSTTTTAVTYAYFDRRHGNASVIETTVDDAFMTRVKRTAFEYDYSDAGAWWLNKLVRTTGITEPVLYKVAPRPDGDDSPQTVVRELRWHDVESPRARLVRAEVLQPGDASQELRIEYEHDGHGNVVQETVRAAGAGESRVTAWTFTPDGYFAAEEQNPAGHVATMEHAPGTGLVLQESRYGVTARYEYDRLGRLVMSHRDGAAPAHVARLWCDATCPPRARWREATVQDGAPVLWEYMDALGRVIKTTQSGFAGGADVVSVTEYNGRGYVVAESQPSEQPGGAYFTRYSAFDALGRPGRRDVDQTGLAHDTLTTLYAYSGATTRVTLPDGRTAERTLDARGLLLSTVDAAGSLTSYRHDAAGNVLMIEDSAANRWTMRYDALGRRLVLSDPDSGASSFAYNGFGELVRETDANGHVINLGYDTLGRTVRRLVDGVLDAEWFYDNGRPGMLDREQSADDGFARTYTYDDALRPVTVVTELDGREYVQDFVYGAHHGHLEGIRYPSGEILALDYDRHGYLQVERDPRAGGVVYRRIDRLTPRGQVEREQLGNGLLGEYRYVASTGQVSRVQVTDASGTALQDLSYDYDDPYANLTRRENHVTGAAEVFAYDPLQRLRSAVRTWRDGRPSISIDYEYDALGNLIRKDDFAQNYQYGNRTRTNRANAGPHAVTAVTLPDGVVLDDFVYDATGNMLVGNGRFVQYDALGKPIVIREGNASTCFWYAPNGERYKQIRSNATDSSTTYYVGKDYERIIAGGPGGTSTADGEIFEKTYIGGYLVIEQSSSGRHVRYLHGDRLGSVDTVTDESGAVLERHGYDAFGKPLTGDWEDAGGALHSGEYPTAATTRGFTGHEHLDAHGLVHMNGRIYDPALGRFLSVDPFIQSPGNSQSLNPYSYVFNTPLSGVDPTGYTSACADQTTGCTDSTGYVISEVNVPKVGAGNGDQGQGSDTAPQQPVVEQGGPGGPDGTPDEPPGGDEPENDDSSPQPIPRSAMGFPLFGSWFSRALDYVQIGLDAASVALDATGVGASVSWLPDMANAGISAARGDWKGAGLSVAAAVPVAGAGANAARIARTSAKIAAETAGAAQAAKKAASVQKASRKGHTATYQLRNPNGTFKQTGTTASGGTSPGSRLSWPQQQALHSEGKILEQTANKTSPGDILTIQGQKQPCNMCKGAMNKAAKERQIDIQYKDSAGNIWKAEW